MSDYNAYLKRMERQCAASNRAPSGTSSPLPLSLFAGVYSALSSVHGDMVPLSSLRSALGGDRQSQDDTITYARASGRYTLTPCDRYTTPELIAASYTDSFGDTYHYISVRE